MKPDYKNWIPKDMIWSFLAGAVAALALCLVVACTGLLGAGTLKTVLAVIFAVLLVVFCALTNWSVMMYRAFDYNGKRNRIAHGEKVEWIDLDGDRYLEIHDRVRNLIQLFADQVENAAINKLYRVEQKPS